MTTVTQADKQAIITGEKVQVWLWLTKPLKHIVRRQDHPLTCALFDTDSRALQVGRLDKHSSTVKGLWRQAIKAVLTLSCSDGDFLLTLG